MASRVFVHVGAMKSATTYLQGLCQVNRAELRKNGLLWPGIRIGFQATEHLFNARPPESAAALAWRTVDEDIRQFPGDVLLSNELLLHRDPRALAWMRKVFKPAKAWVVITARDLGRVVPSQWQTTIRSRGTVSWADYSAAVCSGDRSRSAEDFWRKQDLVAALERWRRIVPLERIVLVTVPPSGSDHRVVGERLLTALGHPPAGDLRQPTYHRTSIGAHSAELLRQLNLQAQDLEWSDYRFRFKTVLGSLVLEQQASAEPGVRLSAEQWSALSDRAASMVDGLERLGVRVIGDLSDLRLAEQPPADGIDPGESNPEELLEVARRGLIELTGLLEPKKLRVSGNPHSFDPEALA